MLELVSSILIFLGSFMAPLLAYFEKSIPPCTEPIIYEVGSFDRHFNLSQKNFLSALSEAETIWEKSIGVDLFQYDPERGELVVNLIYDYRQEATNELTELKGEVAQDHATYMYLEKGYNVAKAEYDALKTAYDARVEVFSQMSDAYDERLNSWNNSPRANRKEFEQLEKVRIALETELASIKLMESHLNSLVRNVNTLVVQLNSVAKTLNLVVKEYNTIGVSRGDTFTGGVYTSDVSGERIDIFEFENHEKLVRVLAHELGHALGLDHVDDPTAIMYKLNEDEAPNLSAVDLNELKKLCQIN